MRPFNLKSSRERGTEAGAAVVEFALVSLILVSMFTSSIFFTEALIAKIKLQEATRYATWELTDIQLSDYMNHNHDALFSAAWTKVVGEVTARWGDDLSGDSPSPGDGQVQIPSGQGMLFFSAANFQQAPSGSGGGPGDPNVVANIYDLSSSSGSSGGPAAVSQIFNGAADALLFDDFKFNSKGLVDATFQVDLNLTRQPAYSVTMADRHNLLDSATKLTFSNRQTLLADAWDLKDGTSIVPQGSGTAYGSQLKQMAFLGLLNVPGVSDIAGFINTITGVAPNLIEDPLGAPWVATNAYTGFDPSTGEDSMDVGSVTGVGESTFDTSPMRETEDGDLDSDWCRTFMKRDQGYLGCQPGKEVGPTASTSNYPCDYSSWDQSSQCE
jgi:hypothetical protein